MYRWKECMHILIPIPARSALFQMQRDSASIHQNVAIKTLRSVEYLPHLATKIITQEITHLNLSLSLYKIHTCSIIDINI